MVSRSAGMAWDITLVPLAGPSRGDMELSAVAMDGSGGGDFTDRMRKHVGVLGAFMVGRHCNLVRAGS